MPRALCAVFAGLVASLILVGAAFADTTVSFYSHGWGVTGFGYVYFPHAFIVVRRTTPGDAPQEESYGFTAVSQGPDALVGPTKGEVVPANPAYVKQAVLHFTLTITDEQYQALRKVVDAWGGPDAPPYDLRHHNCVDFAAALTDALGLQRPTKPGQDPSKFLEEVKRENASVIGAAVAQ